MFTATRLYFTHDLTCQFSFPFWTISFLTLLKSFRAHILKQGKRKILASETHLKECWFFSLVYIYADVVNGIFGITSRGGDGKKGQDGGNGAAGRDSGDRVGMLLIVFIFLDKAFSVTWSATLKIHWNEKRFLHKKKRFNSHRISLGHQRGLCFVVQLERQNWFAHF